MHLPHHRRSRTLADHLFRGLANAFAMGIALEAVILATASTQGVPTTGPGSAAWAQVDQVRASEARLMQKYDCSATGDAGSVTPQSAIVRSPAGRLRVVSFEEGWSVYTERGPAMLVAVCLEPPASGDTR